MIIFVILHNLLHKIEKNSALAVATLGSSNGSQVDGTLDCTKNGAINGPPDDTGNSVTNGM
jgi:hypothetical protein